jgi:hypothetical protein
MPAPLLLAVAWATAMNEHPSYNFFQLPQSAGAFELHIGK